MNWDFSINPIVPLWWIAALAGLGLVLIAINAYSRLLGWPLRLLTLSILAAALINPVMRQEDREPLADIAVAVIDRSQSQDYGNRLAQADSAEKALKEAVGQLGNTELRVVTARSGITAEDDGTRLFSSLDQALADVPPERFAGAIMVTDGQVHDIPEQLDKLGFNAPVHGLLTGQRDERDRRIVIESAPRFGIVGKEQTIKFRVDDTAGGNGQASVAVRVGNADPITVTVETGKSIELPVMIDHGGQNIAEIVTEPLAGEIALQNNRAMAVIEGVRDRLRVLLVSGEPHPGERTWRNLLKADASVDLVHFTILRPPEKQDGTPIKELSLIAFPTRELFVDKLDEFDLIIFDRYRRQGVLPMAYLANVADYVAKGGAVLIAAGPDYASVGGLFNTPLGDVLAAVPTGDITETPFRPHVTTIGKRHPVTSDLPGAADAEPRWGRWFRLVDATPERGETVMSGPDDKPLLVLSREGEGRVAILLSDHGWLWARGYDGGGPQTELLRRLAHWLMKEPDLEEEHLSGRQEDRNLVIERRTITDQVSPVTVTLPSGKTETVTLAEQSPGHWTGKIEIKEAGLHRLSDGTLEAVAAAGNADPKETADIVATAAKLGPVAQATGGGMFWLAARDGLPRILKVPAGRQMAGSGWLGLKENDVYRVRSLREISFFSTLAALGLLLLAICAMWRREGR
ncbi:MAG: hypothetical protein JNJ53_01290 [Rhizobiales bacterium]|nr:hypothetical protein [Hyphomicrobiales bacterium]